MFFSLEVSLMQSFSQVSKVWKWSHKKKQNGREKSVADKTLRKTTLVKEEEFDHLKESKFSSRETFSPLTMELRQHNIRELLVSAEEVSGGRFAASEPFCLVGLHTCGDLGSTALRLFTDVPNAKALCIVGCCYHHITETSGEQLMTGNCHTRTTQNRTHHRSMLFVLWV